MKPTLRLFALANETATRVSTRNRLDFDLTLSAANELALLAADKVNLEIESFRLFTTYAVRRLIPMVLDEQRVFGPTCGTVRQRKYAHGKEGHLFCRQSSELLKTVPAPTALSDYDFLDRFSERQQQYIVFVLAGYSNGELHGMGFSRQEISSLIEDLEHVYAF